MRIRSPPIKVKLISRIQGPVEFSDPPETLPQEVILEAGKYFEAHASSRASFMPLGCVSTLEGTGYLGQEQDLRIRYDCTRDGRAPSPPARYIRRPWYHTLGVAW